MGWVSFTPGNGARRLRQAAFARGESQWMGGYLPLLEGHPEPPALNRHLSVVADTSGDQVGVAPSLPPSRNDRPQCGGGDRKEASP